jgi:hypothetical protein
LLGRVIGRFFVGAAVRGLTAAPRFGRFLRPGRGLRHIGSHWRDPLGRPSGAGGIAAAFQSRYAHIYVSRKLNKGLCAELFSLPEALRAVSSQVGVAADGPRAMPHAASKFREIKHLTQK